MDMDIDMEIVSFDKKLYKNIWYFILEKDD